MKYQKSIKDSLQCLICPRGCTLKEGQTGFCNARKNEGGKIISTVYGRTTGLAIDPIEKKPLYHFYPNSNILSFGTFGCIMGCRFCQNWQTSKSKIDPLTLKYISPETIVSTAINYNVKSVAFTYNDPVAFFEYALDAAKLCKEAGIKTVAVTSGYINKDPLHELFQYIDAANIDLKGFNPEFYGKNCLAKLDYVLDTIKYVKNETNCHLELTTLLIEGENDSPDTIKQEADWILNNLNDTTPLHFSAFHPAYKFLNRKRTNSKTLLSAYEIAQRSGLKYVYTGNIQSPETSNTYCKKCKKPVILRDGFFKTENLLKGSYCPHCGEIIEGCF